MEWWAIVGVVGAVLLPVVKKLNSLRTVHIEWKVVRLEFETPRGTKKKPRPPRALRQLKQVKRLPRSS